MHRRPSSVVLGLTLLALALTGCSSDVTSPANIDAAPVAVDASPSVSPATSPAPEASPSAAVSASPTAAPIPAKPVLSYDVAAVQRTLTELSYYAGAIDGRSGPALRSAVMAFQKVQGLGIDGTVGANTLNALAAPQLPALRGTGPADRVEVDLTKQVLYVVKDGKIARIMPVSSGNGGSYSQKNGAKARSLTPVGYYKIERRIVGERHADLGTLYDPQYFYRGWAIHGSNSVPAGPASHGCVRVPRADAKYLLQALNVGMSVYLYGGQHTFPAGSSAPGTDAPTGDTAAEAAPSPAPTQPAAAPSPSPASPTPSPTATASPTASPSASPTAS